MRKRRLFNLATGASLLLFLLIVIFWIRSYWRVTGISGDLYSGAQMRGGSGAWSSGGRIIFDTARHLDVSRWPAPRTWSFLDVPRDRRSPEFVDQPYALRWHSLGLKVAQSISRSGDGTHFETAALAVPDWPLALLSALLPAVASRRWFIRRRRRARNECPACGYDLRATPERCPECGTTVTLTTLPIPTNVLTPGP